MENVVWNKPMIILNNIVIMPDTSSHLDIINKEACEAVDAAMKSDADVFMITSKGEEKKDDVPELYSIGVVAKIKQCIKMPNKTIRVFIETEKRARLVDFYREDGNYNADIEYVYNEDICDLDQSEEESYYRF